MTAKTAQPTLLAMALADDGTVAATVEGWPQFGAEGTTVVLRVAKIGGIYQRENWLDFAVPRPGVTREIAALLDRLLGADRRYPICWSFLGDDPWAREGPG
jgi:hypothetical protein